MIRTKIASDKGILKPEEGRRRFELERYETAAELAEYVEHYWTVRWDLRGSEPFSQTVLSHPSVQLAFERENGGDIALVYGVPESTYTRHLSGEGFVLGVKFKPGAFYPFWSRPVSQLTGRQVALRELFGGESDELAENVFAAESGAEKAAIAEKFLLGRLPERDENACLAGEIVRAAMEDREIRKVEDLAGRFGTNVRALQRLFERYVGVSPKWVIKRYRLQEAAELAERGIADWTSLAAELGYYDQAHFIKDFKSVIGQSPEEYARP